jgi:ribonuclease P protein component
MEARVRRFALPSMQRLSLKKAIDSLFNEGKAFISYPLRVVYRIVTDEETTVAASDGCHEPAILVSVAKKRFRHAVSRNRIKRLIRETYRLNKSELMETCRSRSVAVNVAFIVVCDVMPSYSSIEKSMLKALKVLVGALKGVEADNVDASKTEAHETSAD